MAAHSVILLADDSEDDVLLIRKAFAKAGVPNPIQVARDGEEAIAYLNGEGKFQSREEFPLPALILLDLKMPRLDGFQVLQWLRARSDFAPIPVIMLTCSDQPREINEAYSLGANSFLVKPADFEDYKRLAKTVTEYWLELVKTPECERPPRKRHSKSQNSLAPRE